MFWLAKQILFWLAYLINTVILSVKQLFANKNFKSPTLKTVKKMTYIWEKVLLVAFIVLSTNLKGSKVSHNYHRKCIRLVTSLDIGNKPNKLTDTCVNSLKSVASIILKILHTFIYKTWKFIL